MTYTTLDEAVAAKLDLIEHIQSIDVQLSEKILVLPPEEYEAWRAKALRAKHTMTTKLQRTKVWIQKTREQEVRKRIEAKGGADGLLHGLYSLAKTLVSEGAEITQDEQTLLDDIGAFLSK